MPTRAAPSAAHISIVAAAQLSAVATGRSGKMRSASTTHGSLKILLARVLAPAGLPAGGSAFLDKPADCGWLAKKSLSNRRDSLPLRIPPSAADTPAQRRSIAEIKCAAWQRKAHGGWHPEGAILCRAQSAPGARARASSSDRYSVYKQTNIMTARRTKRAGAWCLQSAPNPLPVGSLTPDSTHPCVGYRGWGGGDSSAPPHRPRQLNPLPGAVAGYSPAAG